MGSARRRARARACHWHFQRRPRARPLVSSHVRTCARHDNRDDDGDHAEFEIRIAITMVTTNLACCPSQTLPQAHCARAITGTKPTRHSDGRGRGGAAHGGDGGDRRSHGGAVARAMWQRRVTGRLQTITTARNDRAKARYFNSLLLGYAGGGGSERRWQGPRAHAALWSAVAAVVLAAATCSPSGGGGSGRCLCRCRCNRSNRALNWSSGQRDRSGDRAGCCARRPSGRVRSPQREEEGERR